jgi:hypothetical protein
MRHRTVTLTLLFVAPLSCARPESPQAASTSSGVQEAQLDASPPFSTRNGNVITLHPSEVAFKIPASWVTWYSQHGNNLHLSREQLAAVEKPERDEWDVEFARACEAALPLERCAAHVGSEGWGDDARFYNDLQLRVYDLLDGKKDLEDRIVKAVSSEVRPDKLVRENNGAWRRVLIVYERHHFDYVATAHIDLRLRRVRGRDILFVFMYTNGLESVEGIPSIVNSFEETRKGELE